VDGGVYAIERAGSVGFGIAVPAQPLVRNGAMTCMHIASVGKWLGHSSGQEIEFTAELFDAMVHRFERRTAALSIDYNHKSAKPDATPEQAAAAGWVRSMYRRGDGDDAQLWAVVEFTQRSATMVAAGEYLYCSPEFSLMATDTRTAEQGPEMFAVALTNRPFQDNLTALQLSRETVAMADDTSKDEEKKDDKVEMADGDAPPPATDDKPEGEPAKMDDGSAESMIVDAVAKELGMDMASVAAAMKENLSGIVKAVAAAMSKQDPASAPASFDRDTESRVLMSRVSELKAEIEKRDAADKKARDARVTARVAELVKAGHIKLSDEAKADARVLFSSDWDRAERIYSQKVVPLGEVAGAGADKGAPAAKLKRDDLKTEADKIAFDNFTRRFGEDEAITLMQQLGKV
jgi:phage I-like protein